MPNFMLFLPRRLLFSGSVFLGGAKSSLAKSSLTAFRAAEAGLHEQHEWLACGL
jgi:hypothetical protein